MIPKKLIVLLALLMVSTFAIGQAISSNGGSIQGTITDPSGAAIPSATITVSSPDTGYTHTFKSNSAGYYSLGPLVPGNYVIAVSAPLFQSLRSTTVVRTGTVTSGDEKLSLGSPDQVVTVTAGAL